MRRSCAVFYCTNTTETDQNISFFRFPKDTERKRQWIINCRREDLAEINEKKLYNNYCICSAHFEDSQFYNPLIKNRLTRNAVPTIFNIPNFPLNETAVATCCRLNEDDYQINNNRSMTDNENDLQNKPINIQLMQNATSGLVKEGPFSAAKVPVHSLRDSEKENQKIITGQEGESDLDSLHSLPKALILKQSSLHRNYYGIWSKENIAKGTRFGPYNGILISDENEELVKEPRNKNKRDRVPANWLAYINHAFNKEQQNLIAFQFHGQIFYISCINIPANTELLAGYKCEHSSITASIEDENQHRESHSCKIPYKYDASDSFSVQHYLKEGIANNKVNLFESFRNYSIRGMIHTKRMQVISLQRHQMLRIKNKYICDTCGKKFEHSIELTRHRWLHTGVKPYSCGECGRMFERKYSLKIHERRAHTGEKPYKCDKCEKQFVGSGDLRYHQKRVHTNEKPYGCDECEKKFALGIDLRLHKRIHAKGKPYGCDLCGKKFARRMLLSRHKIRLHTMKPYGCDMCGKEFGVVADLNRHKKVHFKQENYQCDECGKDYAFHSSLIRHKKLHSGENLYNCDLCMKQFIEKGALLRHKMQHAGQKPYECDYCGKKFAQKYSLKVHKFCHTGEQPFECNECGKQFVEKWKLKSHRMTHMELPDSLC